MELSQLTSMAQGLHRIEEPQQLLRWFQQLKQLVPFEFGLLGSLKACQPEQLPICIDFPQQQLQHCLDAKGLQQDPLFHAMQYNQQRSSVLFDPIEHPDYGKRLLLTCRANELQQHFLLLSFGQQQPDCGAVQALYLLSPHLQLAVSNLQPLQEPAGLEEVLSPREQELLGWLQIGKGNWEISRLMGISERTVKYHLQNIYRKLNVSNRTHAVASSLRADRQPGTPH